MTDLVLYNEACRAIAEAVKVDEAKDILDRAIAMEVYARQAKNHDLEADAAEIRLRAERRIGELIEAQKKTVGLATGGQPYRSTGVSNTPVAPTLADAGVDKNLAKRARRAARFEPDQFTKLVAETRKAAHASHRVVKQASKKVEREDRQQALAARILALPDKRYGIIYADPATRFKVFSEAGLDRSADNHYPTMEIDAIKALPIDSIAAPICMLPMWTTGAMMANSIDIVRHWGFEFKALLAWDKVTIGNGYWFRDQTEHLIIATRGEFVAPGESQRIPSLWREAKREHSKKPDGIADWIRDTWPDVPKIELFARQTRDGWDSWGDEVSRQAAE